MDTRLGRRPLLESIQPADAIVRRWLKKACQRRRNADGDLRIGMTRSAKAEHLVPTASPGVAAALAFKCAPIAPVRRDNDATTAPFTGGAAARDNKAEAGENREGRNRRPAAGNRRCKLWTARASTRQRPR